MGNADLDSQDGGKDKKKSFEERKLILHFHLSDTSFL